MNKCVCGICGLDYPIGNVHSCSTHIVPIAPIVPAWSGISHPIGTSDYARGAADMKRAIVGWLRAQAARSHQPRQLGGGVTIREVGHLSWADAATAIELGAVDAKVFP